MRVRAIGCHGGVAPEYQTTCYFVDERFLVDAGSVCSILTPKEQATITDIFITHPHLDHIKDICFLLENTFDPNGQPLILRSSPAILSDIHKHLLNDVLWPDFSKIYLNPKTKTPSLKFEPFEKNVKIDNLNITQFPAVHPGNALGYLIDDGKQQIIFTGDTGPNPEVWKVANACNNLKAIFTEISFPSRMDALAKASGHYTLEQLLDDLEFLQDPDIPVYISHFKPLFLKELMDEFYNTAPDRMKIMHENEIFEFN